MKQDRPLESLEIAEVEGNATIRHDGLVRDWPICAVLHVGSSRRYDRTVKDERWLTHSVLGCTTVYFYCCAKYRIPEL